MNAGHRRSASHPEVFGDLQYMGYGDMDFQVDDMLSDHLQQINEN